MKKRPKKPRPVMADLVPTNWCDPLLTGPTSPLSSKRFFDAKDVEWLLLEVAKRIRKAETAKTKKAKPRSPDDDEAELEEAAERKPAPAGPTLAESDQYWTWRQLRAHLGAALIEAHASTGNLEAAKAVIDNIMDGAQPE